MNFIVKSLIKSKLKGLPEDQVDMIIGAIEKDPGFFQKLALEIKLKIDLGKSEQEAAHEVMAEHSEELKKILAY